MSEAAASRREVLRRGALAAGAIAATGLLRPATVLAQTPEDEDLRDFLVEAIGLEQVTVLAYASAAEASKDPAQRRELARFRDQEQAHANALRSALDELGYDLPAAPESATDTGVFDSVEGLDEKAAGRLVAHLGELEKAKTPSQYLDLLESLEDDQLSYYVGQGPALDTADLATTAVEIAGCQAQHLVVLGQLAGRPPGAVAESVTATAAQAGRDAATP